MASVPSQPPTKMASPDMQLAVLISMGFDAVSAEEALEQNEWKVDESIDFLLAAGISMSADTISVADAAKSIEQRRLESLTDSSRTTVTRRERPSSLNPRDTTNGGFPLVDEWITEEEMLQQQQLNVVDTTPEPRPPRSHRHRHHSRQQQQQDSLYPRGSPPQPRVQRVPPSFRQEQEQRFNRIQRKPGRVQETVGEQEVRRGEQELRRYRQQQEPPFLYGAEEQKPGPRRVADYKQGVSFENRLDQGFEVAGVPTMATDPVARKTQQYGGGMQTIYETQESYGRNSRASDGAETVHAVASESIRRSTAAPPTTTISAGNSHDPNRKDIRRLYILVGVAIALILVGTGVAVGLVFALNRDGNDNADSSTAPPPTAPAATPGTPDSTTAPATRSPADPPLDNLLTETLPPTKTTNPTPSPLGQRDLGQEEAPTDKGHHDSMRYLRRTLRQEEAPRDKDHHDSIRYLRSRGRGNVT